VPGEAPVAPVFRLGLAAPPAPPAPPAAVATAAAAGSRTLIRSRMPAARRARLGALLDSGRQQRSALGQLGQIGLERLRSRGVAGRTGGDGGARFESVSRAARATVPRLGVVGRGSDA
jgi:hypothetical protein